MPTTTWYFCFSDLLELWISILWGSAHAGQMVFWLFKRIVLLGLIGSLPFCSILVTTHFSGCTCNWPIHFQDYWLAIMSFSTFFTWMITFFPPYTKKYIHLNRMVVQLWDIQHPRKITDHLSTYFWIVAISALRICGYLFQTLLSILKHWNYRWDLTLYYIIYYFISDLMCIMRHKPNWIKIPGAV